MFKYLLGAVLALMPVEDVDYCGIVNHPPEWIIPGCYNGDPAVAVCLALCYEPYADAIQFYRQDACERQTTAYTQWTSCMLAANSWYTECLDSEFDPSFCYDTYQFMRAECTQDLDAILAQITSDYNNDAAQALADYMVCATWCCNNV